MWNPLTPKISKYLFIELPLVPQASDLYASLVLWSEEIELTISFIKILLCVYLFPQQELQGLPVNWPFLLQNLCYYVAPQ